MQLFMLSSSQPQFSLAPGSPRAKSKEELKFLCKGESLVWEAKETRSETQS